MAVTPCAENAVTPSPRMGRSDGGRKDREDSLDKKVTRRLMGLLKARLPDAAFQHVPDPRRRASVRWSMETILKTVVTAMVSGCRGLREMEALTEEMSRASRRVLGIPRRLSDTTARTALVGLDIDDLRAALRRQVHAAHRRKALRPVRLPFGVVAMDGKFVSAPLGRKSRYVQGSSTPSGKDYGKLGTITATLLSSSAKVCIDMEPIPATWGEATRYTDQLDALLQAYGKLDLFQLVTYDAGGCSKVNARNTREYGIDYLFRLKEGSQPKLTAEATRLLGSLGMSEALAIDEERYRGEELRRSVFLAPETGIWPRYAGARAFVLVRCDRLDDDGDVIDSEERYYITSLEPETLSGAQWLRVTRGHWSVENNCHHTWDAVLREDDRPWIVAEPDATLVVMLLRRIAYNLLTLYRSVTLRSAANHLTPWRDLMRWLYNALIAAQPWHVEGLRPRKRPMSAST